jgi:hypothetical protein
VLDLVFLSHVEQPTHTMAPRWISKV